MNFDTIANPYPSLFPLAFLTFLGGASSFGADSWHNWWRPNRLVWQAGFVLVSVLSTSFLWRFRLSLKLIELRNSKPGGWPQFHPFYNVYIKGMILEGAQFRPIFTMPSLDATPILAHLGLLPLGRSWLFALFLRFFWESREGLPPKFLNKTSLIVNWRSTKYLFWNCKWGIQVSKVIIFLETMIWME